MKQMKVQSFSDVITNSSSELFVFDDGKNIEEVVSQLDKIYPRWRDEYDDPISIENASDIEIGYYDDYSTSNSIYFEERQRLSKIYGQELYTNKKLYKLYDKKQSAYYDFAKAVGKEPEALYLNWNDYNPLADWNNDEGYVPYIRFSKTYYDIFKENHKGHILVFSKDENPKWKYQQKLMKVANRYHLG